MNQQTKHRAGVAPGWERIDVDGRAEYLPAVQPQRRPMPALGEVLPPAPAESANLLHAWQQPIDGIREHTSAVDRAKAVVVRSAPLLALVGLLAGAGAIVAYALAGTVAATLTFLVTMAALGGLLYRWESHTEYAHSRAGVERLRITEAADLEHARMEHEFNLRRMALEAYIKIMERNHAE